MTPRVVEIREVGPREGFQFEEKIFPPDVKVKLVDMLSGCGFGAIEVGAFVRPDLVPQMADTEEVYRRIRRRDGVKYVGLYLNLKGLERGLAAGADFQHSLTLYASETFSVKNNNRDEQGMLEDLARRANLLRSAGVEEVELDVATAFGCNYEGPIAASTVVAKLRTLHALADRFALRVVGLGLLDTMGWSSPRHVETLVNAVRQEWDALPLRLHIHDTRGLGMASAYAGLMLGVTRFDTAIGGLGGCPFAAHEGAAGNLATEDFVLLCEELGVETGIDLDRAIQAALEAERIVGHTLPGKVKVGGRLSKDAV